MTLDDRLLMSITIPFASRHLAFTVYKAIVVLLDQRVENFAVNWNVEAQYLAVSPNLMEFSPVTLDQLDKCIGSSKYRICIENLAMEKKDW